MQAKKTTGNSTKKNSSKSKTPTSTNGKLASECDSFAEYVDYKSVVVSSTIAMAFAPASIGTNCIVDSAFAGCDTSGAIGFASQFGVNFVMSGSLSILQLIIELF